MMDSVDVRVLRSRRKLFDAVLRLAAQRPIESVSVADLAREAGLNRATFYKHATSPAHALEQALVGELDAVRAEFAARAADRGRSLAEVWDGGTRALLDYVARHNAVFTTGLLHEGCSPVLTLLLSGHVTTSIADLLERRPTLVPDTAPRDEQALAAYSRFVGLGVIGVLQTWLESPPPRDADAVVRILLNILPPWLLHPADAQTTETTRNAEQTP
ncbi:TetR/AcrR family transcriptional regulator [Streptomyces bobili]|uniref:TetR/AcrR family transcriptional regulator n=1 Tax=Streptomyces bobili TaxID=67280 RepID=UPI003702EFF5